jgi:predicted aconitase with swiveling domain
MSADTDSLTPDQRAILQRARYIARFLDSSVRIPGTQIRFDADSILGIVPVIGDGLASLLSLYIVFEAVRAGVPRTTIVRMCLNIVLDGIVGSIPVVGSLFDVIWRANQRNVSLLERHLS